MASDPGSIERAYPMRVGCAAMGCAVLFLLAVGFAGLSGLPVGWAKAQNGQGWEIVLGWAIVAVCGVAIPMLFFGPLMLVLGVRESLNPQILRVTPTSLLLPKRLRGMPSINQKGERVPASPMSQPEEIPFSAIRSIQRETGVGGSQLLITHDLAATTLIIPQLAMKPTDFDELETILRTAIPAVFIEAPPQNAGTGG